MAKYDIRGQKEAAESGGFTLCPEGKHLMRCKGVSHKVVNDKDVWDLDLEVVKGEPNELSTARDSLFFTEKALVRIFLCLAAFGVPESAMGAIDPEDEATQQMIVGRTALVEIVHSKPDEKGRTWANVEFRGYESSDAKADNQAALNEALKQEREQDATGPGFGTTEPEGELPF